PSSGPTAERQSRTQNRCPGDLSKPPGWFATECPKQALRSLPHAKERQAVSVLRVSTGDRRFRRQRYSTSSTSGLRDRKLSPGEIASFAAIRPRGHGPIGSSDRHSGAYTATGHRPPEFIWPVALGVARQNPRIRPESDQTGCRTPGKSRAVRQPV